MGAPPGKELSSNTGLSIEYAGLVVPPLLEVGDFDRLILVSRFIKLTAEESFFSLTGCAAAAAAAAPVCNGSGPAAAAVFRSGGALPDFLPNSESIYPD